VRETAPEPARKTVEATARKSPEADGNIVAPRPRMTEAEFDAEHQRIRVEPEPELDPELDPEAYDDKVEEFLERLRLAGGDAFEEPADWYVWFEEEVLQLVIRLNSTTHDAGSVFETWLGEQALFVLNDDDRDFMIELTFESRCDIWYDVVLRKRKTPRRRGRR
jgi:hypothetical protein